MEEIITKYIEKLEFGTCGYYWAISNHVRLVFRKKVV